MGEDPRNLVDARFVDAAEGVLLTDEVAQGDVQDGAVLAVVDVCAGEHGVAPFLEIGFAREVEEGREDGLGDEIFRVVQEDGGAGGGGGGVGGREGGEAGGVGREEGAEVQVRVLGVVERLELFERGVRCYAKQELLNCRGDRGDEIRLSFALRVARDLHEASLPLILVDRICDVQVEVGVQIKCRWS